MGTTYIMPDGCPTPDCDMSDPECVRTKRWIQFGFTNFHCFVTFVLIPFEVRTLCTYIKALWKVTLFSPFRVASLHKCRLLPTGKSKYVNSPFRIAKKDWTILKSFAISTTCNLRSWYLKVNQIWMKKGFHSRLSWEKNREISLVK